MKGKDTVLDTTTNWFAVWLGRNMREMRIKRGFTQAELARRLHISPTRISRIENGKVVVSGEELNQICKELNCLLTDIWPDASVVSEKRKKRQIIAMMRQLLDELDD